MRVISGLSLLIISAVHTAAFAESNVPIDDVTLYPGSATIGRVAHVTPGMTQLEVKGLPANFDKDTIRVQAEAGINVGQVVTKQSARLESLNAREAELQKKIQALNDKDTALDVDTKSAALVQHYLESLNNAGATERPAMVDAKSMAAVIDTIHHSATEAFDRMQKVVIQKREIGEQIEALQRDLQQAHGSNKSERTITIALNVKQAGAVRLSYQINGAGWKPGYRAQLDSTSSAVELERLATIEQNTGEDWSGVKMTLSTGQPRMSPDAPEPNAWLLSYQEPVKESLGAGNTELFGREALRAPAPVEAYAAVQRVEVTGGAIYRKAQDAETIELQNTFATQYTVPTRVTLPADGREISVNLSAQSLPVRQVVRVAPRLDANAVVTAVAQRPEGIWLSGQVQLFRDGNYVGVTQWNAQDSGPLTFPFGRDDLVRVKVDHAQQQSGTGGFLLGQHRERHVADVYTISSAHKGSVDLLVLEAAPVSTSDEIKVQSTFLPKPTIDSWEEKQGVVGWQKSIAANEQVKISVDYNITYPKDGSTVGLP